MKYDRLMFLLLAPLVAVRAAEFAVAPGGDDGGPGTRAQPFGTLARAQQAVRAQAARDGTTTVWLRGGVYRLDAPLRLGPTDSGTCWQACPGERPVLSGGVEIGGFVPYQGRILKAALPACALPRFRMLLHGGRRLELARYPNVDPAQPLESGWAFAGAGSADTGMPKRVLRVAQADLRTWARPEEAEVSIFSGHEWWNNLAKVVAFDRERRLLTLAQDCSYAIAAGDRYFVRGPVEELDAPGEWYADERQRLLYLWPPEDGAGAAPLTVTAPRLKTLLEIGAGAERVVLRGLTFECCEGTAVLVSGATNCLLETCVIRQVGDYHGSGVSISGGFRNGVVACDLSDIGNAGLSLSGGDAKTLSPAEHYAEDNLICRTGLLYKQGSGVTVNGVGNRVARNTLHDLPRFGIMFGGVRHLIELNHIHHVSLETMDTGAIYGGSLNWLSAHGTVIRHNFRCRRAQRPGRRLALALLRVGHLPRLDRDGRDRRGQRGRTLPAGGPPPA